VDIDNTCIKPPGQNRSQVWKVSGKSKLGISKGPKGFE